LAIVTVALAGTPEAATADFVCDGSDDNIEIAAAIAQLATLGGGTLQIAGGVYSTSRPIIVEHDNIQIVGVADRSTIIRPASDWVSIFTAGGAQPTGVVSFVGVDNFAARNLVVESTTLPMNGIIAIPDGPEGTGQISTNGVFDNNVVRMAQAHTYSIWSLLSTGMTITNNLVDGGATLTNANISQEGIEIFGGDDIVISGNTLVNIGNAAINLISLAAILPDTHLTNIQVKDNIIDASRIGVFVGSTYSAENGAANIGNLEIDGNVITNGFEGGIFVEMQDGILSEPTLLDNLTISNNQIEVLANPSQSFITAALYFDGKNYDGLNISSNVNIFNNSLELKSTTATLPPPSRISTSNSRYVIFYNFEDVIFSDNNLVSDVQNVVTNAISTIISDNVEIRRNDLTGFLGFGMEVSNSSDLVIDANKLIDWGGYVDYFAILVAGSSNVVVSANDVESPLNFQAPIAANIFSTNVSFVANRMIADRDFSIAGTNYRDLQITSLATRWPTLSTAGQVQIRLQGLAAMMCISSTM
jgi:Right handed beta helix region